MPGRPSRGVVTCDRSRYARMRWGRVRVVTTGSRRVVTTRLAQGCWGRTRVKLQQPRLRRPRYGPVVPGWRRCMFATTISPTGVGLRRIARWGRKDLYRYRRMTEISRPFGRRVSGDEPGACACKSRLGDAVTSINRADSASGKFTGPMLHQSFAICNGSAEVVATGYLKQPVPAPPSASAPLTVPNCRSASRQLTHRRAFVRKKRLPPDRG